MKTLFLALLLAAGLALPAHAQPGQEPSPARMAAAREMMVASKVRENFDASLARMLEAQIVANPEMHQFEPVLRGFFAKYMRWDDLEPDFARLYAETYSEEELRELARFYRTPLGQRLVSTSPELIARGAALSEQRVQKHLPELFSAMMDQASRPAAGSGATPTP